MRLLAIETSTEACSVAIATDGELIERFVHRPREHTRILLPMIRDVLAEANTSIASLDAIVTGNGPGSFIGMRIAASVSQGLAFSVGIELLPVSSLAALAAQCMQHSSGDVVVVQDARMGEVYFGQYRCGEDGCPVPVGADTIVPVGELPVDDAIQDAVVAGDAWQQFAELRAANPTLHACEPVLRFPAASFLLIGAAEKLQQSAGIAAETLQPAYLRHTVATPPRR